MSIALSISWAAGAALSFGAATLWAEKILSRHNRDTMALILHVRDDMGWVARFLAAFDALFTDRDWSWARLWRSALATSLGVGALWLLFGPVMGLLDSRTDARLPLMQAMALGLLINFVADFLSLAETRWLLNVFAMSGRWAGMRCCWRGMRSSRAL